MPYPSRSRRWRVVIPLVLLGMVFMRMIWMQLRVYEPVHDARALVALDFLAERIDPHCRFEHESPASAGDGVTTAGAGRVQLARALFTSVGYSLEGLFLCREDWLQERAMGRLNQWLFIGAVIAAVLMTRFIASNWTVALIVAAMLLSRGRLLAELGSISLDGAIALIVTLWAAAAAHFLRTGATLSMVALALLALAGVAFDRALLALALVPLVLVALAVLRRRHLTMPVIRRFRGARQKARRLMATAGPAPLDSDSFVPRFAASARWLFGLDFAPAGPDPREPADYASGGVFRTIQVPFLLWLFARRRFLKLAFASLVLTVVGAGVAGVLVLWVGSPPRTLDWSLLSEAARQGPGLAWGVDWAVFALGRVDVHFGASLAVLFISGIQSPAAGLPSFLELAWALLLGLVLVTAAAFFLDFGDQGVMEALQRAGPVPGLFQDVGSRNVLAWFEPAILSLGAAGVYNLLKVLDTRLSRRG